MTADTVGGVWTYALDLARGLAAHGVKVTVAALGPVEDPGRLAAAAAEVGARILATGLPLEWLADDPAQVEAAGRELASIAMSEGADLVHLNSPALAAGGPFSVPIVAIAHSCVATWWVAARSGPLPPDLSWRAELTGRGYRAADALIAPTRAFAEVTAQAYALAAPPAVVRNGRHAGRAAAPVVSPPIFAFTAGRLWDEGKNVTALDRAAARLAIPVVAAGPTRGPNGATVALRDVRALGRLGQDELAGWVAAASVFVSVPHYEPFGLAVLEAAQAARPLVLSDIPSLRELWDGAALFVPPDDATAIAAAIQRVLGDGGESARLASRARERAGHYTVEAMTAGVLQTYARVLRAPVCPSRAEAAA